MRKRTAALLAILLLALPARAQDTDQQQMSDRRATAQEPPATPERMRANYAFARCVLGSFQWSTLVIGAVPFSRSEESSAATAVRASNSCNGRGRTPPATRAVLRGIMAELLLLRDFDVASGRRLHAPVRRFEMPAGRAFERLGADSQAALLLVQFGECVARADRAGLARLFATPAATPEERAALAALGPALNGCIPQGAAFSMNARQMRGYLAEGAYRTLAAMASGNS
ncbi:MAG: hypothetical protein QOC65_119 [Sphingomonadales bacterium]|nr:hypothetical protein [Sphingomonadales bacterium]